MVYVCVVSVKLHVMMTLQIFLHRPFLLFGAIVRVVSFQIYLGKKCEEDILIQ